MVRTTVGIRFSVIVLIGACFHTQLIGQHVKASVTGTVLNAATNRPIVGANVVIVESTFGALTDISGRFEILNVPPGSYQVRASAVGFASTVVRNVVVASGEQSTVVLQLAEQYAQMPEVVTVGGHQYDEMDLPNSAQYLEEREINHTAGAFDDIAHTIVLLPGVAQTRIDRNDLFVRGGGPFENLYLLDGFELSNINHFATEGSGGGSSSFINLNFIDDISFSGGGFGVRYGDRMSSMTSIGLREGRTDENKIKLTVAATEAGLNLDGPVGREGSYLLSVRRSYLDPLFKIYGFTFAPYFWDYLAKVTYQLGTRDKIELLSVGAIDRMRQFNDTPQERSDNARMVFPEQTTLTTGFDWHHGFDFGVSSIRVWHSYADYDYLQIGGIAGNPYFHNATYEGETSLKADFSSTILKTTELSAGIGGKFERLYSRIKTNIRATGFTKDTLLLPIDITSDSSGLKLSAFAQISQTFGDLSVTLGIRSDYLSVIRKKMVTAPRLSLMYELTPVTSLNVSAGRYYQAPSYIWVMVNPYNRSLTYMGVNQYVLEIDHHVRSDLKVTIDAYLKRYDHYPVSITRRYLVMANTAADIQQVTEAYSSFGLDFMQSSGTGTSRGIDLFIQKQFSEVPIYGKLSVSYGTTEFLALDGVGRPSSNDQRWKITGSGGYMYDENWEFTGTFRMYTGRPYTPYSTNTFLRSSALYNTSRVGLNHSLDLRATRKWRVGSYSIDTYLDVQNVYNKKLLEPPIWDSTKGGVIEQPELGIVPSIGVSVEF